MCEDSKSTLLFHDQLVGTLSFSKLKHFFKVTLQHLCWNNC